VAVVQLPALEAPPRTPLKGTLFDAASVVDNLPIGLVSIGDDLYESWACLGDYQTIVDLCRGGTPGQKTFVSVPWNSSLYASAYLGVTCKGPGFDHEGALGKLRDQYEAIESRVVAQAITDELGTGGTDLGSADPVTALGLLEAHAARYYAGAPTIVMGRGLISPLSQQLEMVGSTLYTKGGSKVAADGDTTEMYVTGEIVVYRGSLTLADALDTATNDFAFLAERSYLITYDCLDAHVTTTFGGP
jgi:hypothetical protein